jgi:hypothetical protein
LQVGADVGGSIFRAEDQVMVQAGQRLGHGGFLDKG